MTECQRDLRANRSNAVTDRSETKVAFPLQGDVALRQGVERGRQFGQLAELADVLRKKARESNDSRAFRSTAATYSPNWWVSTIGDGELNFSVRNGKRWFLTAIATAICF